MSNSQWESRIASDLRYICNRMEGTTWWWNFMQLMLLLWIGLGVWTK